MVQAFDIFTPGLLVRHPDRPDWGVGQVQSALGEKVSVTFENAGKREINTSIIVLIPV
ncbi:MAG TPA: DUF3553 domain-containing protein, partial [Armatimonadetes bacterium]|nr:DUF3553 domain-containing protein [Armatimonadota bacterium]